MKKLLIIILFVIVISLIGYLNTESFSDCAIENEKVCIELGFKDCWEKSKEHCEWIRK